MAVAATFTDYRMFSTRREFLGISREFLNFAHYLYSLSSVALTVVVAPGPKVKVFSQVCSGAN
jgi:hypothetical protein